MAAPICVPLLVLHFFHGLDWLQLLLATPVVLWAGAPFFERGWQSVITRNLNMFTLIAMGTGVAYVYSVVGTLAPQLFPPAFHDMQILAVRRAEKVDKGFGAKPDRIDDERITFIMADGFSVPGRLWMI